MSYGPSWPLIFRRTACYVDKILTAAKPANLPVEQSTKFALAINLRTAKALGIALPPILLARAEEVVESHTWHWLAGVDKRANWSVTPKTASISA